MKQFRKIISKVYDIMQLQNNLVEWVNSLNLFYNSFSIVEVDLIASQSNLVQTKLNGDILGWIILDRNSNSNIWKVDSTIRGMVDLRCDLDCKVKILFIQ